MKLEFTGERVVEEFCKSSPENYLIYLFHMATYNFARPYINGKPVLDFGCGSGYGTHHTAPISRRIVGIDIADDAIDYASKRYRADNLAYLTVAPVGQSSLPFEDASFDTVLSFQVIEHISDVRPYLAEIRRVLRSGGTFVCATPDRSTRLFPGQKPWNMWHIHEYDGQELNNCIADFFPHVELLRMSGRQDILDMEIRRTRRVRWLTLPLTLPFVPEAIRVRGLSFLKHISRRRGASESTPAEFSFDESDLTIGPELRPSVNLVVVARKGDS